MSEATATETTTPTSSTGAAVRAIDLRRTFGMGDASVEALRGIDVTFPRGQFAAVMGPSCSGKSSGSRPDSLSYSASVRPRTSGGTS